MARGILLLVALALTMLSTGCARSMAVRPLYCPVVECKGIRCETPPPGAAYTSDNWRCVSTPRY